MKKRKTLKIIAAAVFLISLFCTVDLGLNLLYNAVSGIHDGSYAVHSILHAVFRIFGDSLWSFDRFFLAFRNAAWITFSLLTINVILHFYQSKE